MGSLVEQIGEAVEPISRTLAKQHLRVISDREDALIDVYNQAARELAEDQTNRSFITKTYKQTFDGFPYRSLGSEFADNSQVDYGHIRNWSRLPNRSQQIKLSKSPLVHVVKISYLAYDTSQWTDLFPQPYVWVADQEYAVGDQIVDSNGNLQEVTTATPPAEGQAPKSGADEPTWSADANTTTTDGDLVWTNKDTAPAGDFLYDRESEPGRVFPFEDQVWPRVMLVPNSVQVYFEAGYGSDPCNVPARAKVLILQLLGNWYENRETVTAADLKQIPTQFEYLVQSLKIMDFAPTRG